MEPLAQQIILNSGDHTVEISLSFCGRDCLLRHHPTFVSTLGRPRGGYIFRTNLNTVIKRRSHTGPDRRFLAFDFEKHEAAFNRLRLTRPTGVLLPIRECQCSYEVQFLDGRIACPASVAETDPLKDRCPVKVIRNREEAVNFAQRSQEVLRGLHESGIWHGDPGYRNFMISDSGVYLIDLDNIVLVGSSAHSEYWDFLRRSLLPILREHLSTNEIVSFCVKNGYPPRTLLRAEIFRQARRLKRVIKAILDNSSFAFVCFVYSVCSVISLLRA